MQVAAKCRENGAEHVDIIPADLSLTKNADELAKTCGPERETVTASTAHLQNVSMQRDVH
jgi:hypothetical protein